MMYQTVLPKQISFKHSSVKMILHLTSWRSNVIKSFAIKLEFEKLQEFLGSGKPQHVNATW